MVVFAEDNYSLKQIPCISARQRYSVCNEFVREDHWYEGERKNWMYATPEMSNQIE